MINALLASLLLGMTYTNAPGHYYSSTGPIQLAQVVEPEWLVAPMWPKTAPFNFSSGPIWTAIHNPAGEFVEPNWLTTEAWSHYSLEPLTVNCRSLYEGLLPQGEVYLFGRIVGGFAGTETEPCWFDLSDGYKQTVRVYPIDPLKITDNVFVRVRMFVEVRGRGSADEIIIMVGI